MAIIGCNGTLDCTLRVPYTSPDQPWLGTMFSIHTIYWRNQDLRKESAVKVLHARHPNLRCPLHDRSSLKRHGLPLFWVSEDFSGTVQTFPKSHLDAQPMPHPIVARWHWSKGEQMRHSLPGHSPTNRQDALGIHVSLLIPLLPTSVPHPVAENWRRYPYVHLSKLQSSGSFYVFPMDSFLFYYGY